MTGPQPLVFAIDPGSTLSAFVVVQGDYTVCNKAKCENEAVLQALAGFSSGVVVIEMVASYGMPVGREVFDTCVWIGRFTQAASALGLPVAYVFRQEEKLTLCHSARANDSNIRRALIDRFAKHDLTNGKGTKKEPDVFYGFAKDMWAAYAVAVTYLDKQRQV